MDSTDASIIWAYGTSAPSNPSDPSSDFQQHRSQGTFSLDMKAAQVQEAAGTSANSNSVASATASGDANQPSNSAAPSGAVVTSVSAPQITGITFPEGQPDNTGLTSRDKVLFPTTDQTDKLDDHRTRCPDGPCLCHLLPPWRSHNPLPSNFPSCSYHDALPHPTILPAASHRCSRHRSVPLHRRTIHLLPPNLRHNHRRSPLHPRRNRILPPPPLYPG